MQPISIYLHKLFGELTQTIRLFIAASPFRDRFKYFRLAQEALFVLSRFWLHTLQPTRSHTHPHHTHPHPRTCTRTPSSPPHKFWPCVKPCTFILHFIVVLTITLSSRKLVILSAKGLVIHHNSILPLSVKPPSSPSPPPLQIQNPFVLKNLSSQNQPQPQPHTNNYNPSFTTPLPNKPPNSYILNQSDHTHMYILITD